MQLIGWTQYQANLAGVFDYAREQGFMFYVLKAGRLAVREYENNCNAIYDLVGRENVDGLIVISAAIGHFSTMEQMKDFFRSYAELPLVSVGMEVEGVPAVMVDNATGLRELLVHLIKGHSYRRFAFITGPKENQDSFERFLVFCKTLQEYGLFFDRTLVAEGDFTLEGGRRASRELLAKDLIHKADAIVAANDIMALGSLMELRHKGISIPREIAVVGFDDVVESLYCSPLLTTVSQPLYEQGRLAAEILLKTMRGGNGEKIPQKLILPAKMVLRESCGCFSEMTTSAGNGGIDSRGIPTPDSFTRHKQEIISGIVESAVSLPEMKEAAGEKRLMRLLDALEEQIQISASKTSLSCEHATPFWMKPYGGEDVFCWQILLSELRRCLLPYIATPGFAWRLKTSATRYG